MYQPGLVRPCVLDLSLFAGIHSSLVPGQGLQIPVPILITECSRPCGKFRCSSGFVPLPPEGSHICLVDTQISSYSIRHFYCHSLHQWTGVVDPSFVEGCTTSTPRFHPRSLVFTGSCWVPTTVLQFPCSRHLRVRDLIISDNYIISCHIKFSKIDQSGSGHPIYISNFPSRHHCFPFTAILNHPVLLMSFHSDCSQPPSLSQAQWRCFSNVYETYARENLVNFIQIQLKCI